MGQYSLRRSFTGYLQQDLLFSLLWVSRTTARSDNDDEHDDDHGHDHRHDDDDDDQQHDQYRHQRGHRRRCRRCNGLGRHRRHVRGCTSDRGEGTATASMAPVYEGVGWYTVGIQIREYLNWPSVSWASQERLWHEKLMMARHKRLIMIHRNRLTSAQHIKLITTGQQKLTRIDPHGFTF